MTIMNNCVTPHGIWPCLLLYGIHTCFLAIFLSRDELFILKNQKFLNLGNLRGADSVYTILPLLLNCFLANRIFFRKNAYLNLNM